MKDVSIPVPAGAARELRVGDEVRLTGRIVTARDAAHKLMVERRPDFVREHLEGGVIYHCGPIMQRGDGGEWRVVSAGPTTSIREEPYEAAVMEEYGVRGVIGKGGMGPKTLEACGRLGAVYFHAVGGAAVYLARYVRRVERVYMLEELGTPEAFWVLAVDGFPAVVTMDSHGGSLHAAVQAASEERFRELTQRKAGA